VLLPNNHNIVTMFDNPAPWKSSPFPASGPGRMSLT